MTEIAREHGRKRKTERGRESESRGERGERESVRESD